MKQFKFRSITSGLLGALLLLGTAAPLTFTACENEHPEINITLTSDYSGIIEAINNVNKSLTDKLALIEAAVKNGNVASGQSFDLIIAAINSLSGSLEQKLAAIESAIKSQTTSLETKLGLIEAALKTGFTDEKTALGEIKSALESLKGSVDGLDGAIDEIITAINGITDALGNINTTVGETNDALTGAVADALKDIFDAIDGLSDYSEILAAIKTAIENIEINGGGDTPGDEDGKINGHEYVEMGDGLKWATTNIGADNPEDYGDYFAWSETSTKSNYSWSTYFDNPSGDGTTFTKYATDKKTVLDLGNDAARQNWGSTWRMPTDAEWTWLRENCTWTWTTQNGVNGQLVTAKNGNSIFLPAAGSRLGTSLYDAGSYGYYWSSSLYEYYSDYARYVDFYSGGVRRRNSYRYYGQSVRPVSE